MPQAEIVSLQRCRAVSAASFDATALIEYLARKRMGKDRVVMTMPHLPVSDGSGLWPVFVISLKDAHMRRVQITSQLEAIDLPFEIFDAIDGRTGLDARHEHMIDRHGTVANLGRSMSDGEYACALSHLALWQKICDDNLPGAIILEDDAQLGPLFADFVHAKGFLAAPLIMLDHRGAVTWRWAKPVRVGRDLSLHPLARNSFLTTGYTISAKGAAFLLAHSIPLRATADWPCDTMPLKPLAAHPRPVDHPDNQSDSFLEEDRQRLQSRFQSERQAKTRSHMRYLTKAYWKRKLHKQRVKRIS